MPKKTSTKTAETDIVPTTTTTTVAAAAPVADKKVKKPKTPKVEVAASTSVAPVTAAPTTPAATTPAATTPVVEVAAVVDDAEALTEQSTEFVAKLQQLGALIATLKSEYKTLEKKWTRELKIAQKQSNKKKRKAGNRAPSGFVKPTRISDELATFLDKPSGSEMARTEVTRDINKYIRTNKLQDETNGRKINPDSKLAALLKLKKTDELTYFNLQRYMSPHFAKSVKTEVTV
jgi:upstream activation factor subunit UAF30